MTSRANWLENVIFNMDMYVPRVCLTCATVIIILHVMLMHDATIAEDNDLNELKVNRADLVRRPWTTLTYALVHGSDEHMWNNVGQHQFLMRSCFL